LRADGLELDAYQARFRRSAIEDFPQLVELTSEGLAVFDSETLKLSGAGLELSDAIGPWLYSSNVHDLMKNYELR